MGVVDTRRSNNDQNLSSGRDLFHDRFEQATSKFKAEQTDSVSANIRLCQGAVVWEIFA